MRSPLRLVAIALVLFSVIRIAATWNVFSATADEGMHLVTGLQVLDEHRYDLHLVNPPLPRVVTAFAPWLAGAHYDATRTVIPQTHTIFHSTGHYKTVLSLARAMTLPFYLLTIIATWMWARHEHGEGVALAAIALLTTQPSMLAHAGVATLDVAGTAGFAVSMLVFSHWLAKPTWKRASLLGIAYGFGIACKLLCLVYVPVACLAIFLVRLACDQRTLEHANAIITILAVPLIAAFVVWASYGFSIGRDPRIGVAFAVPAPAFVHGLMDVIDGNEQGFLAYAMGRISEKGWWWYFPLALALKTTLASLLLFAIGAVVSIKDRRFLEPFAATLAILLFSMTTHVHIGVRYILPIYVPLSIAAGIAFVQLLQYRAKIIAIALLVWHCVASTLAHPDYLAYFNVIAIRNPSYFLVDSNLDWGQDLLRLRDFARTHRIESMGVNVFGGEDLPALGEPQRYFHADAGTPISGWVAVSEGSYRINRIYGGFAWLAGKPYTRIGKSIRVYQLK